MGYILGIRIEKSLSKSTLVFFDFQEFFVLGPPPKQGSVQSDRNDLACGAKEAECL